MVEEKKKWLGNFHPIQFVSEKYNKIVQSEFIRNEKQDMMSLRVKLTWATFIAWLWILWAIYKTIRRVFERAPIEELGTLINSTLDRMITVFIVITIVLLVFIIAYLLGKQKVHIKAGPIELDIDSSAATLPNGVKPGNNGNITTLSNEGSASVRPPDITTLK